MALVGSLVGAFERGEWNATDEFPHGVYFRPNVDHSGREPSPFLNVPFSFWWVITTTTTVGYGDFYPTTGAGKAVGCFTVLSGVLVLALPITIVGSNFAHEYDRKNKMDAAQKVEKKKQKKLSFAKALKRRLKRRLRAAFAPPPLKGSAATAQLTVVAANRRGSNSFSQRKVGLVGARHWQLLVVVKTSHPYMARHLY